MSKSKIKKEGMMGEKTEPSHFPFKNLLASYLKIDRELIIVFLLVAITGIIYFLVSNQQAFLNFFYLPVLIGAYFFGKRYATLSATLSVIFIFALAYFYPRSFTSSTDNSLIKWLGIITWGGFLTITGYLMGLLYEKKEDANREIKKTYQGIIEMLSLIIDSADKHTQSHSYRVSIISEMIAKEMKCPEKEVEDIRIAALLHDLGKLGVSSEVLNKLGKLTTSERESIKTHTRIGADVIKPLGGKVIQILPDILYHHEKYDGSGDNKIGGEDIPLGARIIAVADVYDALISDRPYREGLVPSSARNEIITNSGTQFDPKVVKAFEAIFHKLDFEVPLFLAKLDIH